MIQTASSPTPLGSLAPAAFMARYWQRSAHLIRQAIPGFNGIVKLPALQRLAARDDVESRVVVREGARWHLEHGPFPARYWRNLPKERWTLLVQGLNQVVPAADALLQRFSFIPYARLDDVMVSYAERGGGVGPHVDSYDVFLLQGLGTRQWRISRQRDQALEPRAPLKILKDFRPQRTWILAPGDMLYLPPHIAHDGIALAPCTTFSIGFRAPRYAELLAELFAEPQSSSAAIVHYRDPGLRPTRHPAALPQTMVDGLADTLRRLRFSRRALEDVIGTTLTTPKATVVFDRPMRVLPKHRFRDRARTSGMRLDAKSLMLYASESFYINGERTRPAATARSALRWLADRRTMPSRLVDGSAIDALHDWYRAGWIHLAVDHPNDEDQ